MTRAASVRPRAEEVRSRVRARYARAAAGGGCCSSECCTTGDSSAARGTVMFGAGYGPRELARLPAGANLGLGCGNPTVLVPLGRGDVVLDLGSGAGVDCFLASRKVGPTGRVIGVDMTPEMVARARDLAERGGYRNVEFRLGEIEHLPVGDRSVDVVLSNCVVNLSPDQAGVYREAYRALRPGGQLAITDLVRAGRIPAAVRADPARWPECFAGTVPPREVERRLRAAGFEQVSVEVAGPATAGVVSARIRATRPGSRRR